MLLEIWESLRGYDKWVRTDATVKTSELAQQWIAASPSEKGEQKPRGAAIKEWRSTCTLAWADGANREHTAQFEVSDNSPLFQLYEGMIVSIRYDPNNPAEFYLPGVMKSRVVSGVKWTALFLFWTGVALFILYLH